MDARRAGWARWWSTTRIHQPHDRANSRPTEWSRRRRSLAARSACLQGARGWALILCLLMGLPLVVVQQCGRQYIEWPRQQCTWPCPHRHSVCKGSSTVINIDVDESSYCCLCVLNERGSAYEAVLCPGSAEPRPNPTGTTVQQYNGTIRKEQDTVTVQVPEGASGQLTSYVHIAPDLKEDWSSGEDRRSDALKYLEVRVSQVTKISNSTVNSTSEHARRTVGVDTPVAFSHSSAVYASKGLDGGSTRHMWTDEPVDVLQEAPVPHVPTPAARRDAGEESQLEWYVLDGEPPRLDHTVPLFLHAGTTLPDSVGENTQHVGLVTIMQPWSTGDSAAKAGYVVGMRGDNGAFSATVKASKRDALKLSESGPTSISIPAQGRAFTYFSPPAQVQGNGENSDLVEAVVFLDISTQPSNASVRIYVGVNLLCTARSWSKWVGGYAEDMQHLPDHFLTSAFLVACETPGECHSGDEPGSRPGFASWTIESSQATTWSVQPKYVVAEALVPDVPRTFEIDVDTRVALFKVKPTGIGDRLFFQLMPGRSRGSRTAYGRWEDLNAACRIMATAKSNGEWAYYQLSDWGYTTDGTPGLQVMVSQWDPGTTLYLQIFLKTTVLLEAGQPPNGRNEFTVVCYFVDASLQTWRWWFGGIFLALFVFCMARCALCRSASGYSMFDRRAWRRGNAPQVASESAGGHVELRGQVEFATTTEQPPDKLTKVGDTLYCRPGATGMRSAQVAETTPGGPRVVSLPNEGTDADATCSICMDSPPDAVLLECGHGGVCVSCAESIWNQRPEGRLCPMCRVQITGIVKIVSADGADVGVEVQHYSLATPQPPPASFLSRMVWGRTEPAPADPEAGADSLARPAPRAPATPVSVRNDEHGGSPDRGRPAVTPEAAAANGLLHGVVLAR